MNVRAETLYEGEDPGYNLWKRCQVGRWAPCGERHGEVAPRVRPADRKSAHECARRDAIERRGGAVAPCRGRNPTRGSSPHAHDKEEMNDRNEIPG